MRARSLPLPTQGIKGAGLREMHWLRGTLRNDSNGLRHQQWKPVTIPGCGEYQHLNPANHKGIFRSPCLCQSRFSPRNLWLLIKLRGLPVGGTASADLDAQERRQGATQLPAKYRGDYVSSSCREDLLLPIDFDTQTIISRYLTNSALPQRTSSAERRALPEGDHRAGRVSSWRQARSWRRRWVPRYRPRTASRPPISAWASSYLIEIGVSYEVWSFIRTRNTYAPGG
jgi:hypothetical protein